MATRIPIYAAAAAAAMGAAMVAGAGAYAAGALPALSRLEPGHWQVRELGTGSTREPFRVCVSDTATLMQLEHRRAACSRLVLENGSRTARVHYTCTSDNFGDTMLRFETPRLAKIETQGVLNNRPFYYRAELRRLGPCPKSAGSR